jgi:hypothetical protein
VTRVNLPPTGRADGKRTGCYGLEFGNGEKVTGRPGGSVDVDDRQAAAIRTSQAGKLGVISSSMPTCIGTKGGRRCEPCGRLWNVWSVVCPRCGRDTVAE